MENKQTLLAVVLSLIVLLGWNHLAEYMGWSKPVSPQPVVATQAENTPQSLPAGVTVPANTRPASVFTPSEGQDITIQTPLFTAVFYSGGGILKSFTLANYSEDYRAGAQPINLVPNDAYLMAPMGLTVNSLPSWSVGAWAVEGQSAKLEPGQSTKLSFTTEVDGIRVTREMTISADTYKIAETLRLQPLGEGGSRPVRLGFKTGTKGFKSASNYDTVRVGWLKDTSLSTETAEDKLTSEGLEEKGDLKWGGVMTNFFMAAVAPHNAAEPVFKSRIQDGFWGAVFEETVVATPGTESVVQASWWYGAKDRELLAKESPVFDKAVDFGWFGFISRPLLSLLTFFYGYVGNWGVSIILLTCLIRIVFFPLSQKSYKSMEKMKQLQPHIAKLKEKYGDNKEQMNREVMQLYKTYGANPASGCLPILVQIPVFFGLYQALLNSIELRHAPFISYLPFTNITWMADLSAADPLYISPILMGATMFLQQKMSPPMGDAMQQKVMLALPIVFTVMFLNFPVGLVIYWFFNNLLSIGQQWLMVRKK